MNVVLDEPPESQRLQLLNDVWKVVMKLNSPEVHVCMPVLNNKLPSKKQMDT